MFSLSQEVFIYFFLYFIKKFSDSAIKSVVDYNSLPKQAKDMANVADLSSQVIDQNFEVFADIIRFVSKDKIIPNRKEST